MIDLRDTLFVAAARELAVTARRSRGRRSAVFLIATVGAVLLAVAAPELADALLIIATELVWLASVRTCFERNTTHDVCDVSRKSHKRLVYLAKRIDTYCIASRRIRRGNRIWNRKRKTWGCSHRCCKWLHRTDRTAVSAVWWPVARLRGN